MPDDPTDREITGDIPKKKIKKPWKKLYIGGLSVQEASPKEEQFRRVPLARKPRVRW
jgi:hypothetical protein